MRWPIINGEERRIEREIRHEQPRAPSHAADRGQPAVVDHHHAGDPIDRPREMDETRRRARARRHGSAALRSRPRRALARVRSRRWRGARGPGKAEDEQAGRRALRQAAVAAALRRRRHYLRDPGGLNCCSSVSRRSCDPLGVGQIRDTDRRGCETFPPVRIGRTGSTTIGGESLGASDRIGDNLRAAPVARGRRPPESGRRRHHGGPRPLGTPRRAGWDAGTLRRHQARRSGSTLGVRDTLPSFSPRRTSRFGSRRERDVVTAHLVVDSARRFVVSRLCRLRRRSLGRMRVRRCRNASSTGASRSPTARK